MKIRIFLIAAILLGAHGSALAQDAGKLKTQYLADATTSEEIKTAIRDGIVIPGMCPFQAFAAAGMPGQYKVVADKKWGAEVPPPDIISAQCDAPDDSTFVLLFRNRTQFKSADAVVFRAKFAKGKVVAVDQQSILDE